MPKNITVTPRFRGGEDEGMAGDVAQTTVFLPRRNGPDRGTEETTSPRRPRVKHEHEHKMSK